MCEYILQFLIENGHKPALLSRGYGRTTHGFIEANSETHADMIGDEPFQVKRKFPDVCVAVCEDRVKGIEMIMSLHPNVDVIVLDDSFQHRKVEPGLNILLTDYSYPYDKNHLLPFGTLREPIIGRKRADVVIVTKCPDNITKKTKKKYRSSLKVDDNQELFFTGLEYKPLKSVPTAVVPSQSLDFEKIWEYKILIFTGIASNTSLQIYLESVGARYKFLRYPDHHKYTDTDINKIIQKWNNLPEGSKVIMTTEKDWRRLEGTEQAKAFSGLPLYYLPISVQWVAEEEKILFNKMLLNYVESN